MLAFRILETTSDVVCTFRLFCTYACSIFFLNFLQAANKQFFLIFFCACSFESNNIFNLLFYVSFIVIMFSLFSPLCCSLYDFFKFVHQSVLKPLSPSVLSLLQFIKYILYIIDVLLCYIWTFCYTSADHRSLR